MTGPDHYLAAERLLEEAQEHPSSSINKTASLIGQAQVHATLALAAATALNSDGREWAEVAGTKLAGLSSTRVTMENRAGYSGTVCCGEVPGREIDRLPSEQKCRIPDLSCDA
jgi:hypothetical protein